MTVLSVLDAAGCRRSPATMPGYHAGRSPHNTENDLDLRRGSLLVRNGKGGRRREVGWTGGAASSCARG